MHKMIMEHTDRQRMLREVADELAARGRRPEVEGWAAVMPAKTGNVPSRWVARCTVGPCNWVSMPDITSHTPVNDAVEHMHTVHYDEIYADA